MKTQTLVRRVQVEKAKQHVIGQWKEVFPGELGEEFKVDRFHQPKMAPAGKKNLFFMVDGKTHYHQVDEFVSRVFDRGDLGTLNRVAGWMSKLTYPIWYPLTITWNLGFGLVNPKRDAERTWANEPMLRAMAGQSGAEQARSAIPFTLGGKTLVEIAQAAPEAWRFARGKISPEIRGMLERGELRTGYMAKLDDAVRTQYERILTKYDMGERSARNTAVHVAWAISNAVSQFTQTGEYAGKIMASRRAKKIRGTQAAQSLWVRSYAGTPNTQEGGMLVKVANALQFFFNVNVQGWRTSAEAAATPNSRMGWWIRFALVAGLPAVFAALARRGLLGDELKEWHETVSDYIASTMVSLPLGWGKDQEGNKVARSFSVPMDSPYRLGIASSTTP